MIRISDTLCIEPQSTPISSEVLRSSLIVAYLGEHDFGDNKVELFTLYHLDLELLLEKHNISMAAAAVWIRDYLVQSDMQPMLILDRLRLIEWIVNNLEYTEDRLITVSNWKE